MTKQEKIRVEIEDILSDRLRAEYATEKILAYLHSQGVVIKVDRELPSVTYVLTASITPDELMIIEKAYRKAYAGHVAVEPLIKE